MPEYSGSATEVVPAEIDAVWAAMLDYDRMPEWQSAVRTARVIERDEAGRGVEVAYEIDARIAVVRYTLRHHYEEPTLIRSAFVTGDFHDCRGEWTFADRGDGSTDARFELTIDPGRMIPAPLRRLLSQRVMRGAIGDLRRLFAG